jgi:PAS domain S-box-containing protein
VAICDPDITKPNYAQNKLKAQNELLVAISEAQALFISGHAPDRVYAQMLQILVRSTGSEYGFLDEVIRNPDGKKVERILAISDISWDAESKRLYEGLKSGQFEIMTLDNLAGAAVLEQRAVIANDASNDPRAKGLPKGHPAIQRYMGMPLYYGGEIIGVVGVANRPDDYTEEIAAFIQPLIQAASAMIQAGRVVQREREMLAALKASEEKYRRLAETSNEGIWAVDAHFRTTYVNPRMVDMLGRRPSEMLGRSVDEFLFPDDLGDHRDGVAARHQRQGEKSYEQRFQRGDGSPLWALVSATPLYDEKGEYAGSFSMLTDITARKRMEDKLRQNETRFRQMFINAPMPYQSLDEQGNFLDVNQAFLDALGYSRNEIIGRNFGDILQPEWVDHFKENFPRFKAVGEILGVEFEMVKKDGSTILVFFNGKIQRDEENHFQRTHCIFQDITENRRIQATLKDRERYLSAILETIQEGFWALDENGRFLDVNAAYCGLSGYRREELLKLRINDLDAIETPTGSNASVQGVSNVLNPATDAGTAAFWNLRFQWSGSIMKDSSSAWGVTSRNASRPRRSARNFMPSWPKLRRWNPSAAWPAGWLTISTICSWLSSVMRKWPKAKSLWKIRCTRI